jgi:hypothetical protein
MCRLVDTACRPQSPSSRVLKSWVGALALALATIGCGAAQSDPATADDVRASRQKRAAPDSKSFRDVQVSTGANTIGLECVHNAYEKCNALDEDCNGVIDDECGYEGGDVQITVGWNSGADLDLYVTDPSGTTLYYNEQHKRSRIGGHLDHDARGDCRREQQNPRIENAYWPAPARAGKYGIVLHYFSPCAHGAATEATLSVAVGGELLGTYRYQIEPEQRIEALSFVKR